MNNVIGNDCSHLQRLMRIEHVNSKRQIQTDKSFTVKDARQYSMSMNEALCLYLQQVAPAVVPKRNVNQGNEDGVNADRGSLIYRMSVDEIYRIEQQKGQDASEANKDHKKQKKALVGVPIEKTSEYEEIILEESSYDKLDVNRSAGFLLYSYDKKGEHSILGEDVRPSSYGGRITSGDFWRKA